MGRMLVAVLTTTVLLSSPLSAADTCKKAVKKAGKLEQLFKKLDTNNDGKLSLDEFRKIADYQPKLKQKPGAVDKRFARLDKNGDGFVSLEELKSGSKKKKS